MSNIYSGETGWVEVTVCLDGWPSNAFLANAVAPMFSGFYTVIWIQLQTSHEIFTTPCSHTMETNASQILQALGHCAIQSLYVIHCSLAFENGSGILHARANLQDKERERESKLVRERLRQRTDKRQRESVKTEKKKDADGRRSFEPSAYSLHARKKPSHHHHHLLDWPKLGSSCKLCF